MGHKPWDRPWKRAEKAREKRRWKREVGADVPGIYLLPDVNVPPDVLPPSAAITPSDQKRRWKAEIDTEVGAVYIALSDRHVERTVAVGYGVQIDEDTDGNLVGVEVLGSQTESNTSTTLSV